MNNSQSNMIQYAVFPTAHQENHPTHLIHKRYANDTEHGNEPTQLIHIQTTTKSKYTRMPEGYNSMPYKNASKWTSYKTQIRTTGSSIVVRTP